MNQVVMDNNSLICGGRCVVEYISTPAGWQPAYHKILNFRHLLIIMAARLYIVSMSTYHVEQDMSLFYLMSYAVNLFRN